MVVKSKGRFAKISGKPRLVKYYYLTRYNISYPKTAAGYGTVLKKHVVVGFTGRKTPKTSTNTCVKKVDGFSEMTGGTPHLN